MAELDLTKRQIVQLGLSLGVDYALTLSCYDPDGDPISWSLDAAMRVSQETSAAQNCLVESRI